MTTEKQTGGKALSIAMAFGALSMLALMMVSAMKPPAALEVVDAISAANVYNTAGNAVFAEGYINDATGVVTTPNDAGVYTAIANTPLTAGNTDGSGCITFSATTGLFTVAASCGLGMVELSACISNGASSSNVAGTTNGAWHKSGTIMAASPRLMRTEPVDAGNGQADFGCTTIVDNAAAVGTTYGFYVANAGGGITWTTRQAALRVKKVANP